MIKLIASDLDDTLLDRNANISLENKEAIQRAIKRGLIFTIATGRMFQATLPYAMELNLSSEQPLICYNGALIKRVSGEVLYERPLEPQLATAIINYGQERDWTINVYYDDRLFVSEINDKVNEYASYVGVDIEAVGDLAKFILEGNKGLHKILVNNEAEQTKLRIEELRELFGSQAQITNSRAKFIEITSLDAHKGQALHWLADFMGLNIKEVLAVGDSNNDLTMLQMAGVGVAVANASDYVKGQVDFITSCNHEHAIAKIFEDYVLKK